MDYGRKTALLRHFQQVLIKDPNEKGDPLDVFWMCFKRAMRGTHLHIERSNVWKYLREFEFRYNNRVGLGCNDADRADALLSGVVGKRLTYETTGQGA